jgi:hypothetical protein
MGDGTIIMVVSSRRSQLPQLAAPVAASCTKHLHAKVVIHLCKSLRPGAFFNDKVVWFLEMPHIDESCLAVSSSMFVAKEAFVSTLFSSSSMVSF